MAERSGGDSHRSAPPFPGYFFGVLGCGWLGLPCPPPGCHGFGWFGLSAIRSPPPVTLLQ